MRWVIKEYGCILKTLIRTSVFFAVRFTWSRSSAPVRNATHLRTFCFLEVIFAFWGDFRPSPACSFAAQFTLKSALNSHDKCNEFADLLFLRPSLLIILHFERLSLKRRRVFRLNGIGKNFSALLAN